jgi:hypothetical protein
VSRTAASYSLVVPRGSTWEDDFTYVDDAGEPIDLTGYEARMQVRTVKGQYGLTTAETLVMELLTTGADPKRVRIKVAAADTITLNTANAKKVKHVYSLELYKPAGAEPEYVIPLVQGPVISLGEVTR